MMLLLVLVVLLAREIKRSDLGAPPRNPNGKPASQVEFDFLAILKRRLPGYRVVVVQKEFEAELPVDQDGSDATGGLTRASAATTSRSGRATTSPSARSGDSG
jgi:hypothetical protein